MLIACDHPGGCQQDHRAIRVPLLPVLSGTLR
jgi:hypothetical protein